MYTKHGKVNVFFLDLSSRDQGAFGSRAIKEGTYIIEEITHQRTTQNLAKRSRYVMVPIAT
jgi:hypothetical protein